VHAAAAGRGGVGREEGVGGGRLRAGGGGRVGGCGCLVVAVAEWQWLWRLVVAVEQWGSNEPKMSGNGPVLAELHRFIIFKKVTVAAW
jgi:hypothetical protein